MEKTSFLKQIKSLTIKGVQVGLISSLLSSIAYALIILGGFSAMVAIFPSPFPGETSSDKFETILVIFAFGGFYAFIKGVLPALVIGTLGGALIGLILAFWNNKAPPVLSCLVGTIIGTILVVIANYLEWINWQKNVCIDIDDCPQTLFEFTTSYSLFYLWPSIIAILMFAYVGWRVNNLNKPD